METKKTITNDLFQLASDSRVVVRFDGDSQSTVELTEKEFRVLKFLAERQDQLCAREFLMVAVWGVGVHVTSRNVDSIVSRLKKKIPRLRDHIVNVHGLGYRMLSKPRSPSLGNHAA
jgi:two-component system OmpR family response regulator